MPTDKKTSARTYSDRDEHAEQDVAKLHIQLVGLQRSLALREAADQQQVVVAPEKKMSLKEKVAASRAADVEKTLEQFEGASPAALAGMEKKLVVEQRLAEDNTSTTQCAKCNYPRTAKEWRELEGAFFSPCLYTRFCSSKCAQFAYSDDQMIKNMKEAFLIMDDKTQVLLPASGGTAILLQEPKKEPAPPPRSAAPRRAAPRAAPREATPPASLRKCKFGNRCRRPSCQLDHN
jgi:hypothetical protein